MRPTSFSPMAHLAKIIPTLFPSLTAGKIALAAGGSYILSTGAWALSRPTIESENLLYAARNGQAKMLKFYAPNVPSFEYEAKDVNAALREAIAHSHGKLYTHCYSDVVELLLKEYKADVNAKDTFGRTALILAAQAGHDEIVSLLLKNGADTKAMSWLGSTAVSMARNNNHKAIVELLEKAEANADFPPPALTPQFKAANACQANASNGVNLHQEPSKNIIRP